MTNTNDVPEIISEFEAIASWCAKRGLKGVKGDPLPMGIAHDTLVYIEDHMEEFQASIRAHAYAHANRNTPEGDDPRFI